MSDERLSTVAEIVREHCSFGDEAEAVRRAAPDLVELGRKLAQRSAGPRSHGEEPPSITLAELNENLASRGDEGFIAWICGLLASGASPHQESE